MSPLDPSRTVHLQQAWAAWYRYSRARPHFLSQGEEGARTLWSTEIAGSLEQRPAFSAAASLAAAIMVSASLSAQERPPPESTARTSPRPQTR